MDEDFVRLEDNDLGIVAVHMPQKPYTVNITVFKEDPEELTDKLIAHADVGFDTPEEVIKFCERALAGTGVKFR